MKDSSHDVLTKKGEFWYQSQDDKKKDKDYKATFYYSDSYFFNESYKYNKSLATMSMCLAFSAFASARTDEYDKKSQNVKDLLVNQIDFSDFEINYGYKYEPSSDSIGVVASSRQITLPDGEIVPLIAIAVRGGGYQKEWASNFTLGLKDDHNGFSHAKDLVINNFLVEYIEKHFDKNKRIKIWITGYSRAAAVSNLVAASLIDKGSIGGCNLQKEDIYTYTFATPAGAINADVDKYKNIFNIYDFNDPVPRVAPKLMEFDRYGTDDILPMQKDAGYKNKEEVMLKYLKKLPSRNKYLIDKFKMKKFFWQSTIPEEAKTIDDNDNEILQGDFLDFFIFDLVNEQILDRENYVRNFQQKLRNFFGRDRKEERDIGYDFEEELTLRLESEIAVLIAEELSPDVQSGNRQSSIDSMINNIIDESLPVTMSALRKKEIPWRGDIAFLIKVLVSFGVEHMDFVVTFIHNYKSLRSGHYPEYCLAWLQSIDDNYTKVE